MYVCACVILRLRGSKITIWNPTKDLTNLKILDLSDSEELITTPDFSRLPCLEKINLRDCWNLKNVDSTIGDLKNLVSLDLWDCASLRCLPESVCKLTALETLDIGYSSLEELPNELGNMKSLTRLVVCATQISKLPDSIGGLSKLEILDSRECEKIELLRYDLSREIEGLGELTSMRKLKMNDCTSIERLPNLSNLKHLETLDLRDCRSLREIEGLGELTSMRKLKMNGCTSIERLPNLSNLKHLKRLDLWNCRSLREIEGLEGLASITELVLVGCDSIMVERTLTEKLFQMYSEFGNTILIQVDRGAGPNWMSHSGTGGCTDVRTNNLLGLVFSLDCLGRWGGPHSFTVIVSNNNKIFQSTWGWIGGPMMVIVPREELIELVDEDTPLSHFHLAQARCKYCPQDTTTARIHPLYKLPHESHGGGSSNKRKRAI